MANWESSSDTQSNLVRKKKINIKNKKVKCRYSRRKEFKTKNTRYIYRIYKSSTKSQNIL